MAELENNDDHERSVNWLKLAMIPIAIVFGPLMLADAEYKLTSTTHVEDFLRDIGIHGTLSKLYEPVIDVLHLT